MSIIKVDNILTPEELAWIKDKIEQNEIEADDTLGRKYMGTIELTPSIEEKMYAIAKQSKDVSWAMVPAMVVEYSSEFGTPNLPPHFDGDTNDLIINMQLESNTAWYLGLNLETYLIQDNSALVFNANKEIHWRVNKDFKDGEYVRMMFVRFANKDNPSDYSHLSQHWPSHDIFKDVREFRDSLGTF